MYFRNDVRIFGSGDTNVPDDLADRGEEFEAELRFQLTRCASCGHARQDHWAYYGGCTKCDPLCDGFVGDKTCPECRSTPCHESCRFRVLDTTPETPCRTCGHARLAHWKPSETRLTDPHTACLQCSTCAKYIRPPCCEECRAFGPCTECEAGVELCERCGRPGRHFRGDGVEKTTWKCPPPDPLPEVRIQRVGFVRRWWRALFG